MNKFLSSVFAYKDSVLLVGTPLLLLPLLIFDYESPESRCAFVVGLMAVYWIFQTIPLPVTALFPIVLFPLLGLATTEKACEPYLQATNMLFLASLIVAISIESSGFHKRLALRFLLAVGDNIRALFAGFMAITAFLGVWIINTAATAMILPIADVVVAEVFDAPAHSQTNNNNGHSPESAKSLILNPELRHELLKRNSSEPEVGFVGESKFTKSRVKYVRRLLYICIAFSATIGGTSTLTSNGPNLVFQFVIDDYYNSQTGVDYAKWLLYSLPATVASIALCWSVISTIYLRSDVVRALKRSPKAVLQAKYEQLGPIRFDEIAVCCLFGSLILLWLFRDPEFAPGWATMLGHHIKPKDTTPAILIVILMFCLPKNPFRRVPTAQQAENQEANALLDWPMVQSKLAWGVVLLRGGAFSMANIAQTSGLTRRIGSHLNGLDELPISLVVIIVCVLASLCTELAGNSAIATIFLPIVSELARVRRVNPLLFLVPVTVSCSFAFILPVGTPANALAAAHARLKPADMLAPGVLVKLICLTMMFANLFLVGTHVFDLNNPQLPQWALQNRTL